MTAPSITANTPTIIVEIYNYNRTLLCSLNCRCKKNDISSISVNDPSIMSSLRFEKV